MAELVAPRIAAPEQPLGRLAFVARFVRNPLAAIPRTAYEEDFVSFGRGAWITSPALVKAVLLDQRETFRKLTQIRLLGPLLGKGILTSEGADWRWQRQAAAPMFRPAALTGFVPGFVRAAEDALARWRARPTGTALAIEDEMARLTFDVISTTLLPSKGARFASRVQQSVRTLQRHGGWDILYAALAFPRWTPRPGHFAKLRAIRTLRAEVLALLREGGSPADDLMRRLVAARDPESGRAMDEEQLVDNLLTFYLAGHETTATALGWTLYLLARAPEWAAALEEEVERVTGGAPVAGEHIERLALVQQVLKESMRLLPPVPIMSRQAIADTEIEGHAIRAGMSLLIPIYVVHRHARRWQRAEVFDPTRFSAAGEAGIARYQYMPFGAGPRVCIGQSFAMMEAAAILATLVRAARFSLVDEAQPALVAGVTLRSRDGLRLAARPR